MNIATSALVLQKATAKQPVQVLPLIEKYEAPPYPKSAFLSAETYDYRKSSKRAVPPTLTDTFIADIWQRITMDLKLKIEPENVTDDNVKQAIGIYLTKRWDDIPGYRPWTHFNFISSLKESKRDQLIKEVVAYIKKNGVKDPDK